MPIEREATKKLTRTVTIAGMTLRLDGDTEEELDAEEKEATAFAERYHNDRELIIKNQEIVAAQKELAQLITKIKQ